MDNQYDHQTKAGQKNQRRTELRSLRAIKRKMEEGWQRCGNASCYVKVSEFGADVITSFPTTLSIKETTINELIVQLQSKLAKSSANTLTQRVINVTQNARKAVEAEQDIA